jgi:hypothetical protein
MTMIVRKCPLSRIPIGCPQDLDILLASLQLWLASKLESFHALTFSAVFQGSIEHHKSRDGARLEVKQQRLLFLVQVLRYGSVWPQAPLPCAAVLPAVSLHLRSALENLLCAPQRLFLVAVAESPALRALLARLRGVPAGSPWRWRRRGRLTIPQSQMRSSRPQRYISRVGLSEGGFRSTVRV